MDNNYLWDRSGKPDPEVQELEELLGTLRYQPQPLEIPANFQVSRRRSFYPPLAIAATLLLFAVAIGIWLNLGRRPGNVAATAPPPSEQKTVENIKATTASNPDDTTREDSTKPVPTPQQRRAPARTLIAGDRSRTRTIRPAALTTEEQEQKEQVLLALRMVSAKLNVAQRKTQGAPILNPIRNQHKIG